MDAFNSMEPVIDQRMASGIYTIHSWQRSCDGNCDLLDQPTDECTQTFTLANSDFNIRSFRSNVVLRWEWRLGSTLYLVWQQNRSFSESQGNLVRPSALWESVTITGDNFLLLKLSYWLPVE